MTFTDLARVSTFYADMNRLRRAVHGYNAADVTAAHAVACRWWTCDAPNGCCRGAMFGRVKASTVYADFHALADAIDAQDFDLIVPAWSNCERWISCLNPNRPACQVRSKEAA